MANQLIEVNRLFIYLKFSQIQSSTDLIATDEMNRNEWLSFLDLD